MTLRVPETVVARVTAADDHYVLVVSGDELCIGDAVTLAPAILERQVFHREVDALQIAAWHRQVAWLSCTARQQDCVEISPQAGNRHVEADVDAAPEDHAFGLHQREPSIEDVLLH